MSAAAWECFHKATLELAKSATLKQRLTDAFSRHLLDMSPVEMPGELRGDFESLQRRMTAVSPMRGETAVAATVRKMSLDEADICAARIVALLDALHRAMAKGASGRTSPAPVEQGNVGGRSRAGSDAAARIPTLISISRV
jgi:hypothetical protein